MKTLVLLLATWAIATENLTFSEMVKLTPGKVTRDQITSIFGKPDNINSFKDHSVRQTWEYRRDGIIKLAVFFDEGVETAKSLDWGVSDHDPEKNLKTAKARFPSATWTAETTKWINPHAAPYECSYTDEKLGISLEYNIVRKEVFRIIRWNPERNLASKEDEKPPMYCEGIEPNTECTPAIPAKEFFKAMGMSVARYCEETK